MILRKWALLVPLATTGGSGFRKGVAFAAGLLAVLGAASSVGYQFSRYSFDQNLSFHPDHRRSVLWDPKVWPAGATLSVAVTETEAWGVDDPTSTAFDSYEEVTRAVDRSLSLWADIESADIRWRVDRVAPYRELITDSIGRHRGIVVSSVEIDYGVAGLAGLWLEIDEYSGIPLYKGCEILLNHTKSWLSGYEEVVRVTAHELGHCLGLAHSMSSPFDRAGRQYAWGEYPEPIWGWMGLMGYLGVAGPVNEPNLDERVAASLVRPQAGWLKGTGSIWGAVVVEGEPARAVYVLASPVDQETGQIGPGVGVYTHRYGAFLIRGLEPGTYALWVFDGDAYTGFAAWVPGRNAGYPFDAMDVEHHIHDTIWRAPVVVRAGEQTGPLVIPVERAGAEFHEVIVP